MLSQVGGTRWLRVEYIHDVHQAPLDQSKSSIVVLAITDSNSDVLFEASKPPRHLLTLYLGPSRSLHSHALPPRRIRRRADGTNESDDTGRAVLSLEATGTWPHQYRCCRRGVMDRFKHDYNGTVRLVVARLDESVWQRSITTSGSTHKMYIVLSSTYSRSPWCCSTEEALKDCRSNAVREKAWPALRQCPCAPRGLLGGCTAR